MSKALQKIEEFKHTLLQDMLKQCTTNEKAFFNRIFPDGISKDKVEQAILLVERTLDKHKRQIKRDRSSKDIN